MAAAGGMDFGLGATIQALWSAGQSIGETLAAQHERALANSQARRATAWAALNHYPWMVDSMRRAGLNPILAVTGGMGGSSAQPATFGPDVGSAHGGLDLISAMSAANTAREQAARTDLMRQQAVTEENKQRELRQRTAQIATDTFLRSLEIPSAKMGATMYSGKDALYIKKVREIGALNSALGIIASMSRDAWNDDRPGIFSQPLFKDAWDRWRAGSSPAAKIYRWYEPEKDDRQWFESLIRGEK